MIDFHEKRKLQELFYSRPFLVFLCIPSIFFLHVAWNAYATASEARGRHRELAAELARLDTRAAGLEQDIANLDDPRGVEAALRKRYGVGKEGEELIVLVADERPEPTSTPVIRAQGLWERVTGWF